MSTETTPQPETAHTPDTLLPCPFCGSEPDVFEMDPGAPFPGAYLHIECKNEACCMAATSIKSRAEDDDRNWSELISKWNRRAGIPDPAAALALAREALGLSAVALDWDNREIAEVVLGSIRKAQAALAALAQDKPATESKP